MDLVDPFFYFLSYSFLGFLLEVAFARVTRSPKQDRKCLRLLPLCPVYGLGALLILLLPQGVQENPLLLLLCGGALATAAEYGLGLFYERVAGVCFWDYSHLPLNLGGKVCLLFSAAWGLLALGLVYGVQPWVAALVSALPPWLFLPAWLFFAADFSLTLYLLRRSHSTAVLRWNLRPSELL